MFQQSKLPDRRGRALNGARNRHEEKLHWAGRVSQRYGLSCNLRCGYLGTYNTLKVQYGYGKYLPTYTSLMSPSMSMSISISADSE